MSFIIINIIVTIVIIIIIIIIIIISFIIRHRARAGPASINGNDKYVVASISLYHISGMINM